MGRIISVVTSAIMVFCLLVHPLSAQQRNMTIGMTNWAENIAVANLWKILLAERGYQAELRTLMFVVNSPGKQILFPPFAALEIDPGVPAHRRKRSLSDDG